MITNGAILVVDDTPANLRLLVGTLAAEGYQVFPADIGELALAAVAAHAPDLILLDIRMPGMGGFEVFRRLKARPESRDIPVMLISASGESAERVEGLKLGAVDFIAKPFHREELLARVQTHLQLRRLRVQLEQQAADLRRANEQLQTELAEHKRLNGSLTYSEKRFSDVSANAGAWIWETDAEGRYTYTSQLIEKILGYHPEEVLQKHFYDYFHPDDRESLKASALAGFAARQPFREFINCNVHKNGQTVWLSTSGMPILDDEGNLLGYRGADTDITERMRMEAERDQLIQDLQKALANVNLLSGLLPICSGCKKIRDGKGYWSQVESYVQEHSEATFTHGLCPECIKKYYPEMEADDPVDSPKETP